jgi:sodium-dependent dicarboxylate transporter 2/3/5
MTGRAGAAGAPKKAEKKNTAVPFILGFGAVAAGALMPEAGGISQAGWRSLAILVFAIVFWATDALPVAATAMGILVMLPVLGVAGYEATFSKLGADRKSVV